MPTRIYHGWLVVGAAFLIALFGWGIGFYGPGIYSRLISLIVAINQFTFAFGPGLLGYLQRAGGSYISALIACLVMQALAAIIVVSPVLGRLVLRTSRRA